MHNCNLCLLIASKFVIIKDLMSEINLEGSPFFPDSVLFKKKKKKNSSKFLSNKTLKSYQCTIK